MFTLLCSFPICGSDLSFNAITELGPNANFVDTYLQGVYLFATFYLHVLTPQRLEPQSDYWLDN
jgi:hypothetical protein